MNKPYFEFLEAKRHSGSLAGFAPVWMPDFLFDFQQALLDWSIRQGRAAIFADCGLGKTPMQLVWAENVVRKTSGQVLLLTPLAVGAQTELEAEKFGIQCSRPHGPMASTSRGIIIANYERLHHYNPRDFQGVVCDESSILKSFDGKTKAAVTDFMRKIPYRSLWTATAAPNDYIELGTSSEALGQLGHMDMLNRFFKNDMNNSATGRMYGEVVKWRFKGHAEIPFWRWVCSWARAVRKPSDLGFDDGRFILPPLEESEHLVTAQELAPGQLFPIPAIGLKMQRDERRRTITERCDKVAELVTHKDQALVWGHGNSECDVLEKGIPDAVQVSGRDRDEAKEEKFMAFAKGEIRVLVTKPRIGAWGLNFQRCAHVTFFPSHSFEQYYQGVRRCWRYGQTRKVRVDIVTTEGEKDVLRNQQRKAAAADAMFANLVREMNQAIGIAPAAYIPPQIEVPAWL